ncbi:MAG TPA: hypothetical protein PKW33_12060 [Anaerolineaceae bacterium]|nr:hypothetical protein [Anaerolineaceae bacterium]HPN52315.1 hypothetical protein [Anaerolineaceae bacterium]
MSIQPDFLQAILFTAGAIIAILAGIAIIRWLLRLAWKVLSVGLVVVVILGAILYIMKVITVN